MVAAMIVQGFKASERCKQGTRVALLLCSDFIVQAVVVAKEVFDD